MGKARADDPVVTVPKNNLVQRQAVEDGFTRVLVDGHPMLIKHVDPPPNPLDRVGGSNAKVIGPTKVAAKVAAVRG